MGSKIIDRTFQSLIGSPCWGLHYDRTLNLSLKFGKPSLRIREPFITDSTSDIVQRLAARRLVTVRGEWKLWIYCCYWQLTSDDLKLASGSSSLRQIEQAIIQLDGQKLVSVAINPDTGATRFSFDLGYVLHCRRFERKSSDELWTLYKPNKYVLSVYGNGTFSHSRSNKVKSRIQPIDLGIRPAKR